MLAQEINGTSFVSQPSGGVKLGDGFLAKL